MKRNPIDMAQPGHLKKNEPLLLASNAERAARGHEKIRQARTLKDIKVTLDWSRKPA